MTQEDVRAMLEAVGVSDISELFSDVPEDVRAGLDLPGPMAEVDLHRHLEDLASLNTPVGPLLSFLGGGVYDHHIPPAVMEIASRAEFLSAYTPYQPEMSQGMLQAIFEYQSLLARLLKMDVVNASMYDGATALGEAVRMAARISRGDVVHIPEAIAPWKVSVLHNYSDTAGISIEKVPYDRTMGTLDLDGVPEGGIMYVETPNYFGVIEDKLDAIREKVDVLIVGVNPISLGVLKAPGGYGADIVVAEGQPLGIPMGFGGPLLGVMASTKKHVRQMPGRLIAMTQNSDGNRAFTMTLQTREQHIRRHRATSNICTNHGLCAVMGTAYLSVVGPGLVDIAERCLDNRALLEEQFKAVGIEPAFDGHHFNEFTVRLPMPFDEFSAEMLNRGVLPGIDLDGSGLADHILVATTEKHTAADIERFGAALKEVLV